MPSDLFILCVLFALLMIGLIGMYFTKEKRTITGSEINSFHEGVQKLKMRGWKISQGVSQQIEPPYYYIVKMER